MKRMGKVWCRPEVMQDESLQCVALQHNMYGTLMLHIRCMPWIWPYRVYVHQRWCIIYICYVIYYQSYMMFAAYMCPMYYIRTAFSMFGVMCDGIACVYIHYGRPVMHHHVCTCTWANDQGYVGYVQNTTAPCVRCLRNWTFFCGLHEHAKRSDAWWPSV